MLMLSILLTGCELETDKPPAGTESDADTDADGDTDADTDADADTGELQPQPIDTGFVGNLTGDWSGECSLLYTYSYTGYGSSYSSGYFREFLFQLDLDDAMGELSGTAELVVTLSSFFTNYSYGPYTLFDESSIPFEGHVAASTVQLTFEMSNGSLVFMGIYDPSANQLEGTMEVVGGGNYGTFDCLFTR